MLNIFPMLLYIFEQMYLITVKWYMYDMIGCIPFMETLKKNFHLICLLCWENSYEHPSFFDDSLYHDLATGCTMTGALHLVNQTPILWFCKKQGTVATATYSEKFAVTHTMTNKIIDLCYTLHVMGVPLDYHSDTFRDNHSIIQQSNIPKSKLMKHWNVLAFHHV